MPRTYLSPNRTYPLPDPAPIPAFDLTGLGRPYSVAEGYGLPTDAPPEAPYDAPFHIGTGEELATGEVPYGPQQAGPPMPDVPAPEVPGPPPGPPAGSPSGPVKLDENGMPYGDMTYDELSGYLKTLSPEQRQAFLNNLLMDVEGEAYGIEAQRAKAERLRETPGGEAMAYGNIYHAANPLGAVVSAAGNFLGSREQTRADRAVEDMQRRRAEALRGVREAVLGGGYHTPGVPPT
jgi:hypothetical protein